MLRETASQTLKFSVRMLNVKTRDNTIRKSLKKYGWFVMIDREKPLLSKRNVAAWLSFAELRCFAHLNAANQHKRLIPTLKILLLNMLSQAIKSLGVLIFSHFASSALSFHLVLFK